MSQSKATSTIGRSSLSEIKHLALAKKQQKKEKREWAVNANEELQLIIQVKRTDH